MVTKKLKNNHSTNSSAQGTCTPRTPLNNAAQTQLNRQGALPLAQKGHLTTPHDTSGLSIRVKNLIISPGSFLYPTHKGFQAAQPQPYSLPPLYPTTTLMAYPSANAKTVDAVFYFPVNSLTLPQPHNTVSQALKKRTYPKKTRNNPFRYPVPTKFDCWGSPIEWSHKLPNLIPSIPSKDLPW